MNTAVTATYLGLKESGLVDSELVLRQFGARKSLARERYWQFVQAGIRQPHREELYGQQKGQFLRSDELVEGTRQRLGDIPRGTARNGRAKTRRRNPSR